jgi:hypothetical protein
MSVEQRSIGNDHKLYLRSVWFVSRPIYQLSSGSWFKYLEMTGINQNYIHEDTTNVSVLPWKSNRELLAWVVSG